jgi:hypothetical protein
MEVQNGSGWQSPPELSVCPRVGLVLAVAGDAEIIRE